MRACPIGGHFRAMLSQGCPKLFFWSRVPGAPQSVRHSPSPTDTRAGNWLGRKIAFGETGMRKPRCIAQRGPKRTRHLTTRLLNGPADVLHTDAYGHLGIFARAPGLAVGLAVIELGDDAIKTEGLVPGHHPDGSQLRFSPTHRTSPASRFGNITFHHRVSFMPPMEGSPGPRNSATVTINRSPECDSDHIGAAKNTLNWKRIALT